MLHYTTQQTMTKTELESHICCVQETGYGWLHVNKEHMFANVCVCVCVFLTAYDDDTRIAHISYYISPRKTITEAWYVYILHNLGVPLLPKEHISQNSKQNWHNLVSLTLFRHFLSISSCFTVGKPIFGNLRTISEKENYFHSIHQHILMSMKKSPPFFGWLRVPVQNVYNESSVVCPQVAVNKSTQTQSHVKAARRTNTIACSVALH